MAQDAHDSLLSDWTDLWRQAGATPAPDLFERLMAAWSTPQRHYHTPQHLRECLAHFRALAHLPDHPVEVGFALFFHDAVYELGRPDNEARSADWARDELLAADLPADLAERVVALILATCHDAEPQGIDAQVLVDIDLAILGAAPARFEAYEEQVRREYGHLPDEVFRRGRMAILRQFRDRAWLFSTPEARERWEAQARRDPALPPVAPSAYNRPLPPLSPCPSGNACRPAPRRPGTRHKAPHGNQGQLSRQTAARGQI